MAATVYLYVRVPKGFFPQQDTGRLHGIDSGRSGHLVSGRCSSACGEFVDIVMKDPAVDTVQAYVGGGGTHEYRRACSSI